MKGFDTECVTRLCGFGLAKSVTDKPCYCGPGDGCFAAYFVTAKESPFHDKQLQKVTAKIKTLFSALKPPSPKHHLSVANTKQGLIFIWTEHRRSIAKDAITFNNTAKEIAKAFQLEI